MKGYKITNCAQDKRVGIVGSSMNDIFIKGCQKLKVTIDIRLYNIEYVYIIFNLA
jgi:hypothetical protein